MPRSRRREPGSGPTGPVPLSAPDLTGPVSILNWLPASGPSSGPRTYHRLRIQANLRGEWIAPPPGPLLAALEKGLRERTVEEPIDLLTLATSALGALQEAGFASVERSEFRPPSPVAREPPTPGSAPATAIAHAIRDLRATPDAARSGRAFRAVVRGPPDLRAELVLRARRRERSHALQVELTGTIRHDRLRQILAALRGRLPLERTEEA
jgi:hypothetical protein